MLGQNINSLISDIRQLNDVQLKQAAKAYERDALVLPLINRELTERVSMRQRLQAQQQGQQQQQQPTIAQQVQQQAEQLPENVGIGQLPAQNIQNMAGGGIVAFANGGDPEYDGTVELREEDFPMQGPEDTIDVAGGDDNDQMSTPLGRMARKFITPPPSSASGQDYQRRSQLLNLIDSEYGSAAGVTGLLKRQSDAQRANAQNIMSHARRMFKEGDTAGLAALADSTLGKTLSTPPAAPAPQATSDAAPQAAQAAAQAAPQAAAQGGGGAPAAGGAPQAGGFNYSAEQALREANLFRKGLAAELQPLYDAERTRREGQTAALEAFIKENKPKDKAHEEYEKILRERLSRSAQDREEAKNDAIIGAGLAMMGETSQNALVNASRGLLAGFKAYGASKKEIRAQEKEIQKGLADIAASRRLEARGDFEAAAKRFETGQGRLDAVYGAQLEMQAALAAKTPEAAAKLRQEGIRGEFDIAQEAVRGETHLKAAGLRGAGTGKNRASEHEKNRIKAAQYFLDPKNSRKIKQEYPNVKTLEDYLRVKGIPPQGSETSQGGGDLSGKYRLVGVGEK